MRVLTLPLKREFFDAIKAGTKLEEYRLRNDYWMQRLENSAYDAIELTLGYPAAGDTERRMRRPWRGFTVKTITHSFFGPQPVQVYAINVADISAASPSGGQSSPAQKEQPQGDATASSPVGEGGKG